MVVRIFELFADGVSPREIAKILDAEGISGPGGREWRDTTIRGQLDRGTGMLNNALYVGRLEWNRCSYVKDPRTGKKVPRLNPREQWEIVPVPELRIVSDELWDVVKARQAEVRSVMTRDADGSTLNGVHRRKYLLSGLLECGVCGGGFTIIDAAIHGCATHRSNGTCSNGLKIRREDLERRVLEGLRQRLLAPELVEVFARAFQEEVNRLAAEQTRHRAEDEARLEAVRRKIANLIRTIEDGMYQPSMKARMADSRPRRRYSRSASRRRRSSPGSGCTRTWSAWTGSRSSGCMRRWPTHLARRGARHPAGAARARGRAPGRGGAAGGDRGRDRADGGAGPEQHNPAARIGRRRWYGQEQTRLVAGAGLDFVHFWWRRAWRP